MKDPREFEEELALLSKLGQVPPPRHVLVCRAPQPSKPAGDGVVRVAEPFWLRPHATFEHVGPLYPVGTVVTITGPAQGTKGSLALFPVSVGGVAGYAALSARDMEGCTTFRHPDDEAAKAT